MKRRYDAILLLGLKLNADGTPRHELTLRIRAAAECFEEGLAETIIPCGGQTPGTPATEAQVMREALLKLGVPDSAIRMEAQSQLTVENFINARKLLPGKRPHVLIVTSDYHMARAKMICRISAGMRASGRKARIPRGETRAQRLEEPLHLIDYMLGYQSGRFQRPKWYTRLMYGLFDRIRT
ncbi:MAG: YdcF family protein [Clostridia bacterium]|nr:YdcF family protein [Clostridia bacterium]